MAVLARKTSKPASMTNAAIIAPDIEITRRIFLYAIYEFTADLRVSKSESNSAPADAENTE